jgi:hypothetical protein
VRGIRIKAMIERARVQQRKRCSFTLPIHSWSSATVTDQSRDIMAGAYSLGGVEARKGRASEREREGGVWRGWSGGGQGCKSGQAHL